MGYWARALLWYLLRLPGRVRAECGQSRKDGSVGTSRKGVGSSIFGLLLDTLRLEFDHGGTVHGDENGVITKHEIKRKMEELISSGSIRKNAINLKNLTQQSLRPGGSSSKGLQYFVDQIKA
ncbi:hypothetical protein Dsin_005805 [Dipteronia sinensis]|uniref:LAGLIDADG homing endonuclease n=1 Tax=Dipteronia sinensis TaxID=43782 RepID=A0AAE0AX65_9ROSI|nr:hypothetical protein Dsin_005805 [Dipteronia sinensis]